MSAVAPACLRLEPVLGLEVHCQLATASKAFCACPARFGDPPNTNTCPTCLGLPGALPVLNAKAVQLAVRLGLALDATVRPRSVFARKNYFYPDLPKGYQISQFEEPLCVGGGLDIDLQGGASRRIRLNRIHIEEDAGKSLHDASATLTFVDFNRSGTALVEIVTEPDFRSEEEVHEFLVALRRIVRHLGVSDGNMEEGSLRCDVNVSVRPAGAAELGTKVELKNLNSFRAVARAAGHEVARQSALVAEGRAVEHGTRLWDDAAGVTRPLRSKELAHDYRYFPDPDLLPLVLDPAWIEEQRKALPELPRARRRRFVEGLGLSPYDAGVLTASRAVADFFEELARLAGDPVGASRWVQGEVLRRLGDRREGFGAEAPDFPVSAPQVARLMALVADASLSITAAKAAFEALAGQGPGADVDAVVAELGLAQESDEGALLEAVRGALDANASAVADHEAGNARTFGFLVGQVMKATGGRANPKVVNELLRAELRRRAGGAG